MSKSRISGVVVTAMLALGLSTAPAFALAPDDTQITVGDSTCQLSDANLGGGVATDPWMIGTEKELAEIVDCRTDYHFYVLSADIDLTPSTDGLKPWNDVVVIAGNVGGWTPLGDNNQSFTGSFNGKNHTISNLTINRTASYQGLFGSIYTGQIKNLTLNGSVTVDSDYQYIGGLVGNSDYLNISNVNVDVNITTASNYVGQIAGNTNKGSINDVTVSGDIISTNYNNTAQFIGGVIGYANYTPANRVTSNGLVDGINESPTDPGVWSGSEYVGGIYGEGDYSGVSYSTVNGDVTGQTDVGGIMGYGYDGLIDNVTMAGNVIADNTGYIRDMEYIGGLVGYWEDASLTNSKVTGDITVNADDSDSNSYNQAVYYVGGLTGRTQYSGISDSSSEGAITINADGTYEVEYVGGIVGDIREAGLARVSRLGDITSENTYDIGGIAGYVNQGVSVIRAIHTGDIEVTNVVNTNDVHMGGILGYADDGILVESSSSVGDVVAHGDNASNVGGIIGYSDDTISIQNSFVRGNVSGQNDVGGIIGLADSEETQIENSYIAGAVTADNGSSDIIVGNRGDNFAEAVPLSTVTFDSDLAGYNQSAGQIDGHLTSEMKTQSTFESLGWSIGTDTSIWKIDADHNDGYPYIAAAPASSNGGGGSGGGSGGGGSSASATRDLLGPIGFTKSSAKLSTKAKLKLRAIASALKAGGYDKVTVKSYTKSTNTKIAVKRNKAVVAYLKARGVTVKLYKEAVTRSSKKKNNKIWIVAVKNAVV